MASKVEEAIVEIETALAEMAPAHEGLRDYAHLVLSPDTGEAVQAAIRVFDRRRDLLHAAQFSLQQLVADGYPATPPFAVTPTVLGELSVNAGTIEAALARFESNAAADLGLTAGEPEPKV